MTQQFIDILTSINPSIFDDENADLFADGIIDSFDVMRIIAELERVFAIEFSIEEVSPENFASAKSIWALAETLKGEV